MLNNRNKGKRGELDVIKMLQPCVNTAYSQLRLAGYDVGEAPTLMRNLFQCAIGGSDVHGLDWLALEVKCDEQMSTAAMWLQAVRQAKPGQLPIVIYKRKGAGWKVRLVVAIQIADSWAHAHTCVAEISTADFCNWFTRELMYRVANNLTKANSQKVS